MKKLYKASSFREFCFIFDSEKFKDAEEAAHAHVEKLDDMGDISDIWEIERLNDIPDGWEYRPPLGGDSDVDCSDLLRNTEWANAIARRLEKEGYELEDTFAEDLWRAVKNEIIKWEP